MQLTPKQYLQKLQTQLEGEGNPTYGEKQMKYMKDKFPYYGLQAKVWLGIFKNFFRENGIFQGEALREFVDLCNEEESRK